MNNPRHPVLRVPALPVYRNGGDKDGNGPPAHAYAERRRVADWVRNLINAAPPKAGNGLLLRFALRFQILYWAGVSRYRLARRYHFARQVRGNRIVHPPEDLRAINDFDDFALYKRTVGRAAALANQSRRSWTRKR